MTGGLRSGGLYRVVRRMAPVARSIRAREPSPTANSESPLLVSEPGLNDSRLISSAPHIPPATRSGCPAGLCVGDGDPDTDAVAGGVPSLGAPLRLWCEVATVAMPAPAPACANASPYARISGNRPVATSPFQRRRRQRRNVFTMIFLT